MSEQTIKCPICGDPYNTYSHYAGNQSACPSCKSQAEENINIYHDIFNQQTIKRVKK